MSGADTANIPLKTLYASSLSTLHTLIHIQWVKFLEEKKTLPLLITIGNNVKLTANEIKGHNFQMLPFALGDYRVWNIAI